MSERTITEEQLEKYARAFEMTWEAIAPDLLAEDNSDLSREDAFEIVTDADHAAICGYLTFAEMKAYYDTFTKMDKYCIMMRAMPYSSYGL